jgi:hypothetical protein
MNEHEQVTIGEDVNNALSELDFDELKQYGLTAPQTYFAVWCSVPKAHRYPSTQNALAQELGVSAGLMTKWSNKPEFQQAVWHLQMTWIKMERFANIADNMCNIAEGNSSQAVAAARFVADVIGYDRTPSMQVNTQVNVTEYIDSDEFDSPRQKLLAYMDELKRRDALAIEAAKTNGTDA